MGVSFRAIAIGLILIPINAFWLMLCSMVWLSGQPTTISLFYNVVFILFFLVLGNLAVKKVRRAWALTPPEILVVYSMLAISSAVASLDMLEILVPTLSHLHRFAPLEGRYQELLPHVPEWLVVTDAAALESAYVGQESMYAPGNLIPWLRPMFWWGCFTCAVCAVMWGLNLLFRKQWCENEKLAYPIIQVPMLLAAKADALFRNKLFWLAFAVAAGIDLVNGLHSLYPLLPEIPIVHVANIQAFFRERPWNAMGPVWISFYPFAIGMCFFMPTDLALSCWFFFLFWKLQRVLASHIGMHGMPGFPFVEEQTAGGYYAIALMALWVSRHHLARLGRILLGRPVDDASAWDREEAWTALVLIVFGGGFLVWFCLSAGMSLPVVLTLFGLYFLISIAITRMRAELGPPSHDLHAVGPQLQIVHFLGMAHMRKAFPADMTMFAFFQFFNRAYRGHPMPHGMEAYRIAERLRIGNRRYTLAMGLAVLAGIITGFWSLLWIFNYYGASQISGLGEWFGRETWEQTNRWFTAPETHQLQPTYAILLGLASALALAVLRLNLRWWPLHPVGYAISGSWSMDQLWFCVFIAWLLKTLLLKYGGAKAYQPAIPIAVGLILGDFIMGSLWNLYGIFAETQVYHFWPY